MVKKKKKKEGRITPITYVSEWFYSETENRVGEKEGTEKYTLYNTICITFENIKKKSPP